MHLKINQLVLSLLVVLAIGVIGSCKKTEVTNPYSNQITPVVNDNPSIEDLDEGSFAWLHAKIFRPTCANSGCHDGTFEPEFRSIASTYNSLVYHPTISNTPDYSFHYRVRPGIADSSFLIKRMTSFVPNTSGVMPPSYAVGDDWNNNESYYINKIKEWINGGAKDMYGQPAPPASADAPPLVYGLVVFPHNNTTTPYQREAEPQYGVGAIEVPSDLVDVWIYPFDDHASPDQFESISLLASTSSLDFTSALSTSFALSGPVYSFLFDSGLPVPFVYKATLDLSSAAPGTYYYLRNYLDDGAQPTLTEIPNSSSSPIWYLIFSLKVVS